MKPLRSFQDVVFLGSSPENLLAACQLARRGVKVLLVSDDTPATGALFLTAPLQALLQQLHIPAEPNGRSHLQVISDGTRLDLQGWDELELSLERELGAQAAPVRQWFTQVHRWGQDLYQLLCTLPAPCLGRGAHLSLHWATLTNLPYFRLRRPFRRALTDALDTKQQRLLWAAGAGLCTAPTQQLSLAEVAVMLYAWLSLPRIAAEALSAPLQHALESFRGQVVPRAQVSLIDPVEGGWKLKFTEGAPARCRHLVKSASWLDPWDPLDQTPEVAQGGEHHYRLESLGHAVPPPMAPTLVLAGDPPLLLQITEPAIGEGWITPLGAPVSEDAVRQRLTQLLPFAAPKVTAVEVTASHARRPALIRSGVPLRLPTASGESLRLCGVEALPHLPGLAPSLTAFAAAQLLEKTRV